MDSLRSLFRIGHGPSSSHTMAPAKASRIFKERNPEAASFHVILYGSLAATGKGHLTDKAIIESFAPVPVEISWKANETIPPHTNGMKFQSLDVAGSVLQEWTTFSIGGGDISDSGLRETKACHESMMKTARQLRLAMPHAEALGQYLREVT